MHSVNKIESRCPTIKIYKKQQPCDKFVFLIIKKGSIPDRLHPTSFEQKQIIEKYVTSDKLSAHTSDSALKSLCWKWECQLIAVKTKNELVKLHKTRNKKQFNNKLSNIANDCVDLNIIDAR